MRMMPELWVHT